MYYKRKIDQFLINWKNDSAHKPLIVKGARQIGKTESILHFANQNYSNVVYINFVLDKKYSTIVNDGYDVETVIKNISLANPRLQFIPEETIIIFDEIIFVGDLIFHYSHGRTDLWTSSPLQMQESLLKIKQLFNKKNYYIYPGHDESFYSKDCYVINKL